MGRGLRVALSQIKNNAHEWIGGVPRYAALPKIGCMNWTCPVMSPLASHRTCSFLILCIASYPAIGPLQIRDSLGVSGMAVAILDLAAQFRLGCSR